MTQRIYRSIQEPIRENLSWEERWGDTVKGLLTSWEVGRKLRIEKPELAECASNGELPVLGWKGGVTDKLKTKQKFGHLFYLAQWQGLRGEDLDIDLTQKYELVCAKTGIKVIYTNGVMK